MFVGPPIDDLETFGLLPRELRDFLERCNGYVALHGGLHFRGACFAPVWHSLRYSWKGPGSLHTLFPAVSEADIPFAQDALGDQFILRDGAVYLLRSETGELEAFATNLREFDEGVQRDPGGYLLLQPLEEFCAAGGELQPGQLLSVSPPFVFSESSQSRSYRAVGIEERIRFLADLARQLRDLPDGSRVALEAR